MSPQMMGLIVGGLLPALLYGVAGVFAKISTNAGMPVGSHLICIGLAVSGAGIALNHLLPGSSPSSTAVLSSGTMGLLWGLGTGLVALGLLKYQAPLAKLVPLYNMNTLVTVLIALFVFVEWRDVNLVRLMAGAVLVIIGGVLVSSS
ncbi:MAG: hypothetical protein VKK04_26350 [Synechococcales bacterium]|nr:hypothetical protein [Synechococcales bacterium]